eukprot:scaffold771_cov177-Alexandrium_tamarense.AAC.2
MPLSDLLTRHAPITANSTQYPLFYVWGRPTVLVVNIRCIITRFICAKTAYTYKLRHPPLQCSHRFIITEVLFYKQPCINPNQLLRN